MAVTAHRGGGSVGATPLCYPLYQGLAGLTGPAGGSPGQQRGCRTSCLPAVGACPGQPAFPAHPLRSPAWLSLDCRLQTPGTCLSLHLRGTGVGALLQWPSRKVSPVLPPYFPVLTLVQGVLGVGGPGISC